MNSQPRRLHLNLPRSERIPKGPMLQKVRAPLVEIMHPHWSPADDHKIMRMKSDGKNFSVIAESIKRSRISVEQRFHRLRSVKDILKKLESFGLSSELYSMGSK